jgi:hypothetical protein
MSFKYLIAGICVLYSSPMVFAGENHFKFISNKCESEAEVGPESSPQSPPLDIDDPGTPGCNKWEINVTVDGDFSHGERHLETPLFDINYGIGDNIQLKYEIPSVQDQSDQTTTSGFGNSKVGIKYLFFESEEDKVGVATYPQYSAMNLGPQQGSVVTLPLLFTRKIGQTSKGDVTLNVNLGYNITNSIDSRDYVSAAVGAGVPLSPKLAIMGEIATEQAVRQSDDGTREQLVKLNVGMMGTLNKNLFLYGSVGSSVISSDDKTHLYALTGFRVLTGNN